MLSTYREDTSNKLQVLNSYATDEVNDRDFYKVAQADIAYPATKVKWDPQMPSHHIPRLASTSQYLQLWEVEQGQESSSSIHTGHSTSTVLTEKLKLISSKSEYNALSPLTSFDWNPIDTNLILACSVDTTCTLWDINKQEVVTQLIAHDSEVYDVKFVHNDVNTFFSVGADGSVRLFDVRSLQHSTIIFEPPRISAGNSSPNFPLLRLDTCKTDQNIVAVSGLDSSLILILDMRYAGSPTFVLDAHRASINSIAWHPHKQALLSSSDDCQAMVWDLSDADKLGSQTPVSSEFQTRVVHGGTVSWPLQQQANYQMKSNIVNCPNYNYLAAMEINYADWDKTGRWFGVICGKAFQGVKL